MEEFFEPPFTIDFTDATTRRRIRSAQMGESITVKVRLAYDQQSTPIDAVGTRSSDGTQFDVQVITHQGNQHFGWNYPDVVSLTYSEGGS